MSSDDQSRGRPQRLQRVDRTRYPEQPSSRPISIVALGTLVDQTTSLENIGRRIVLEAVRQEAAQRLGLKDTTPAVIRRIGRGQVVPADLLNQPDLVIDDLGQAADGWEKTWTDLIVWERAWAENEASSLERSRVLNDLRVKFQAEDLFAPEELAIVRKLHEDIGL